MIFLGETFSGFVTVHNDSQDMVKDVSLKVKYKHVVQANVTMSLSVSMDQGLFQGARGCFRPPSPGNWLSPIII